LEFSVFHLHVNDMNVFNSVLDISRNVLQANRYQIKSKAQAFPPRRLHQQDSLK
jgi:hypothetical protein